MLHRIGIIHHSRIRDTNGCFVTFPTFSSVRNFASAITTFCISLSRRSLNDEKVGALKSLDGKMYRACIRFFFFFFHRIQTALCVLGGFRKGIMAWSRQSGGYYILRDNSIMFHGRWRSRTFVCTNMCVCARATNAHIVWLRHLFDTTSLAIALYETHTKCTPYPRCA